jgi:hypothetical protein
LKICVIGFAGLCIEALADERMASLRRVADLGIYGPLQYSGPASMWWLSMAASQHTVQISANHFHNPAADLIWSVIQRQGRVAVVCGLPTQTPQLESYLQVPRPECDTPADWSSKAPAEQWDSARKFFSETDWDYFQFLDSRFLSPEIFPLVDQQLGTLLDSIEADTILLLVSAPAAKLQQAPLADGMFVLASPNCPLAGEFAGARLVDMMPTVLDLAGYPIPESMQGRSLVAGMEKRDGSGEDTEKLLRERLSGLGYI